MKQVTSLLLMLSLALFAQSQSKNFIDQPYIEVNGTADTLVTPNEIYIRILVQEKDTRDRVSVEEQEQRMVAALKGLGIDIEKDLTTADMTSNFKYYLIKSKDVVKSKLYMLKVTDAVTASQVFIKLEELGISNTSIDRVDHSDIDQLKNQMRTKAIIDARERADALTKPLNQSAGQAIHIVDTDNGVQALQGRVPGVLIRGYASVKVENPEPAKIEFEKIKVSASVAASFVLK